MSWLNKVGNGLNQVASAAAAGASAAGNAVQQGAATVKASAAASVEPKRQSSPQRWLIEVTPNPERQTLDLKLVDSKKKNKNSKGSADEGNESWAIAWPPTVSLTVVHRHYSMGIPPTQVADRERLGELQQVQNSASASDGTSMFTCSYGPVHESLLLESATKAAATNLDNGASYLPHEVFHELNCAVSVECVESLTIPAIVSGTIDVAAEAFDIEFQEGSDFEPEFDPLPTESITKNPLSLAPGTISIGESAGFVALVSKAFKLEDARPILQVMPDEIRNALCLSILGTDPKSVAWPDTVVLGPRGMNLGGMAAKATAGHTRLSQRMDQKNAYTISPSDISAFPGKKPTVTVTASLTMPGGSTWTVESNLCSPAAAAPRLRVTPDPSDTCLVLSIDKIPCGTSVIFPDSISLAYGARRRTVQLSVQNTGSASAGGSQRYPVTPDVIQSAKSSVGAKHTVQVTAVIISGVEWSKLESNYFCLSDVRPKLQMIPCPRTRLLRLSILGVPHDQIKWPDNVSLKYIKIRHNGAHLSHNAMDIGQANNGSYPDEATFGPITDEILNEVDCRPYINSLAFTTNVIVRGVSWAGLSLSAGMPFRISHGLDERLFLYHILSCSSGGDAFSIRCRKECWQHRADQFLKSRGGVSIAPLQICRDKKIPTRADVAGKALSSVANMAVDLFAPEYALLYKGLVAAAEVSKYGAATFMVRKDIGSIISTMTKILEDESANIAGVTMEDMTFGLYYLLAKTRGEWGESQSAIEQEHRHCTNISDAELARIQWMHNLATWAYEEDIVALQRLVHHQGFEIIVCTPGNAKSRPAFHVLAHQQNKLIVITVRGTKDFKDILSDLDCKPTPFTMPGEATASSEHYSHEGMNEAADWLISETIEILRLFVKSGFTPVFTGHSLGGGVATLAVAKLAPEFSKVGLKCYGYGNPPVMSSELATSARAHTVSVCHEHDVIPRLSSGNVSRLLMSLVSFRENFKGKEVALSKGLARGFLAKSFGASGIAVDTGGEREVVGSAFADMKVSIATICGSLPELKIPGRIIHVYKVEGVYRIKEAPDFNFAPLNRIEPFLDMVNCHSNKPYKEALESARVAAALGTNLVRVPWTGFDASVTECKVCARDFCWAETFSSPTHRDLIGRIPCALCGMACCPQCTEHTKALPNLGMPMPQRVCNECYFLPPQDAKYSNMPPKW